MSRSHYPRFARTYATLVGAMDFATGVSLLAAPAFTLAHMGATPPLPDAIPYVRFVGVFVAAVGAMYFLALFQRNPFALRAVFACTLIPRGGAGLFTAIAVATAVFDRAWLIVSVTDLGCAAVQLWLLTKGLDPDE